MSQVKRYGFYRCPDCKKTWESAYTFCQRGSNQPLYKQECKDCNVGTLAYKTEPLKCSICGQEGRLCQCDSSERHVDPNKPHRSDLCQRCQSGRPCAGGY